MTRRRLTRDTIEEFMNAVARVSRRSITLYLTGGSTAVLMGFRDATIDIDLAGDLDRLFSEIPRLKERLRINIELAKPTDFVPSLEGEESRHLLIGTVGKTTFMHFDLYSQVFAKIVRGHVTDIADATAMIEAGLVDAKRLHRLVRKVSDRSFARYTRLTRSSVEAAVESFVRSTV